VTPGCDTAVVLAGGAGVRLRPLTLDTPKPLLPVAGQPFLLRVLAGLVHTGITRVLLATSYRAEQFAALRPPAGLAVECVAEAAPLGTGGALRQVAKRLTGESFLVLNGDSLSGADLAALIRRHVDGAALATILLTQVADARPYGSVVTDGSGRVTAFREKVDTPTGGHINAGVYVLRRAVVEAIPPGRPASLEREVFPDLLRAGAPALGHLDPGYWIDIGTPESYLRACQDAVLGRAPGGLTRRGPDDVLVLGDAAVDSSARVGGGSTIGGGTHVAAGARVDASVLMTAVRLGPHAEVARSVLAARVSVGAGAVVRDAVIGAGARIGAYARVTGHARIWPGCKIPPGASVHGGESARVG
jgi:mannose-1-phosphate guanylyltransferase